MTQIFEKWIVSVIEMSPIKVQKMDKLEPRKKLEFMIPRNYVIV